MTDGGGVAPICLEFMLGAKLACRSGPSNWNHILGRSAPEALRQDVASGLVQAAQ